MPVTQSAACKLVQKCSCTKVIKAHRHAVNRLIHMEVKSQGQDNYHAPFSGLGQMPSPSRLEHIPLIEGTTTYQTSLQLTLQLQNRGPPTSSQHQLSPLTHSSYTRADGSIFIGAGQPAVPATLVRKIRVLEFIDMKDFSPNQLGIPANHQGEEASRTSSKGRTRNISSIVEWLQCYAIYLSVMCRVHPGKIPDMLAYQIIILEASLEFKGRCFCQNAAADPNIKWEL